MNNELYPKERYFSRKQSAKNPVWASLHLLEKVKLHGILNIKGTFKGEYLKGHKQEKSSRMIYIISTILIRRNKVQTVQWCDINMCFQKSSHFNNCLLKLVYKNTMNEENIMDQRERSSQHQLLSSLLKENGYKLCMHLRVCLTTFLSLKLISKLFIIYNYRKVWKSK